MSINFFVPGLPRPGGSKRAFVLRRRDGSIVTRGPGGAPVVNIVDDAKGNKEWRTAVGWYARKVYTGSPMMGPLALRVVFYLPRPKGHFGSGKNAGVVKESAPRYPTGKPDCTKLLRSTEDALKSILWVDDSQIVTQFVAKEYGAKPGATITVESL